MIVMRYYWRVQTKFVHYSFLVGWASSPSCAGRMPTPQELYLLHHFSCVNPLPKKLRALCLEKFPTEGNPPTELFAAFICVQFFLNLLPHLRVHRVGSAGSHNLIEKVLDFSKGFSTCYLYPVPYNHKKVRLSGLSQKGQMIEIDYEI